MPLAHTKSPEAKFSMRHVLLSDGTEELTSVEVKIKTASKYNSPTPGLSKLD